MFVIPVKYNGKPMIQELVKSIRRFHPRETILIVDSCSQSYEYMADIQTNIAPNLPDKGERIHFMFTNTNYVDGAVWKALENFPRENYFYVLHDSMLVNSSLAEFKQYPFVSLMHFNANANNGGYDNSEQKTYVENALISMGINPPEKFIGLFGITFFANREILEKLKEKGLNNILPKNKNEMMGSERIWGIMLKEIGVDITEHSVMGDCFSNVGFMNKVENQYLTKFWEKRN